MRALDRHRRAPHDREPAWSPDGATLAFVAQRGEWYELQPARRRRRRRAAARGRGGGLLRAGWHPDGDRIAAVRSAGSRFDLVVVDAADGDVTVVAAGGVVGDAALDGGRRASSPRTRITRTPPELRLVARGTAASPLLAPAPLAVRAAPHVRARGASASRRATALEIQALLFRPAGRARAPVPRSCIRTAARPSSTATTGTVTPSTSSTRATRWLALNYRGSTGTGKAFERLNFGDWGGGDRNDCLAAADFLRTARLGRRRPARHLRRELRLVHGAVRGRRGRRRALPLRRLQVRRLRPPHDLGAGRPRRRLLHAARTCSAHPVARTATAYLRGSPVHRLDRLAVPLLIAHGELRRARPPEAVRGARRRAAPARQDVRVRDLSDRGARLPPRRPAARLLSPPRAVPRLVPVVSDGPDGTAPGLTSVRWWP